MSIKQDAGPQDFLVEIGTEEMPPKALKALSAAFHAGIEQGLESAALEFGATAAFATPRRLAVRVNDLAARQADRQVERRGPPVRIAFDADGNPTKAAEKFAQGCGAAVAALDRLQTPKGEWLVYRATQAGKETAELLPGIIDAALDALPIPRRMRWGSGESQFVRPVHWVVMLLGGAVVPCTVMGIRSANTTYGHRFMAPDAIVLESAATYETLLHERGKVIADFASRRHAIEQAIVASAEALQGTPVYDDELLDEVTALVEWPVAVTGGFDEVYLDLPPEVLVATLQEHQRYFPVRNAKGELINAFITVSNIESSRPEMVQAGNERVVRPRLADAAFFYATDQARPLAARVDALGKVVFEKQLGTVLDKTGRITALAGHIANALGADEQAARRAATLCKTDLVTEMVGEFPSLQGTMGRYYALHDGELPAVAHAIEEQYQPRFAGAALPASETGRVLSLADKIDTIVGIFGIGRPPTGTRDPFGLRRLALGVLRMVIEDGLTLDLRELIALAVSQLPVEVDEAELQQSVYDYMMERLRAWYLDAESGGFTTGMFDAVLARSPAKPLDFHWRMLAVRDFVQLNEAQSLAAANKRVANILRTASDSVAQDVNPKLLTLDAEKKLFACLNELEGDVLPLLESGQYREALVKLAALREPVDGFFDDVLVMDEDDALRMNRLALLDRMRQLFLRTADLSRLQ